MMDADAHQDETPISVDGQVVEAILARKKAYNTRSLCWGIPGFIMQAAGSIPIIMAEPGKPNQQPDDLVLGGALLCVVVGTPMLVTGLVYYTKAISRHWAWSLLSFVPYGIIGMAFLKDKTPGIDMIRSARMPAGQRMSKLAVASAVLGLVSILTCFPAIPGLVCGVMALVAIGRQPAALKGRGWAIVGIITSVLMTIVLCIGVCGAIHGAVSGK
jgi:hypothetical protein